MPQHSRNLLLPLRPKSDRASICYLFSSPGVFDASLDVSSYDSLWQQLFVVVLFQTLQLVGLADSFGHGWYSALRHGLMPNHPLFPRSQSKKGHRRIRQNPEHLSR
jgi:hypothetical protein